MNKSGKAVLLFAAAAFAVVPLLSQTSSGPKPKFEVISIKPTAPNVNFIRLGGARGDRYTMTNANLRMFLQNAYGKPSAGIPVGQLQIIGGPSWIDSDRYDVQARADCSNGVLSREQLQLMVQSMLEDRFELKAHMETRELPIYNLVVVKEGSKLKRSEDQTPILPSAAGPPQPCGPVPATSAAPLPPPPAIGRGGPVPRGALRMMVNQTGMTIEAGGASIGTIIGLLQQTAGRPIVDKTE